MIGKLFQSYYGNYNSLDEHNNDVMLGADDIL